MMPSSLSSSNLTPANLSEQNQQLLLKNQTKVLQLTSRYIDELEAKPVTMENVQILANLAMASGISCDYIDYLA